MTTNAEKEWIVAICNSVCERESKNGQRTF